MTTTTTTTAAAAAAATTTTMNILRLKTDLSHNPDFHCSIVVILFCILFFLYLFVFFSLNFVIFCIMRIGYKHTV